MMYLKTYKKVFFFFFLILTTLLFFTLTSCIDDDNKPVPSEKVENIDGVTSISLDTTNLPDVFEVGDLFPDDLYLTVYYENNTSESIKLTQDMVMGFDTSSISTKFIQVQYKGKFAYAKIQVGTPIDNIFITPSSITLASPQYDDDEFDFSSYEIFATVYYSNGNFEYISVTENMLENFNKDVLGSHYVTFTYKGAVTGFQLFVNGTAIIDDFEVYCTSNYNSSEYTIKKYVGNSEDVVLPDNINGSYNVQYYYHIFDEQILKIKNLTIPTTISTFTTTIYDVEKLAQNPDYNGPFLNLIINGDNSYACNTNFNNDIIIKSLYGSFNDGLHLTINIMETLITSIVFEGEYLIQEGYISNGCLEYLKLPTYISMNYPPQANIIDISSHESILDEYYFANVDWILVDNAQIASYQEAFKNESTRKRIIDVSDFINVDDLYLINNKTGTLLYYIGKSTSTLVIPSNIIEIGPAVFRDSPISRFIFEGALLTIGDQAFYNCVNLKYLKLPNSVISIGNNPVSKNTVLDISSISAEISIFNVENDSIILLNSQQYSSLPPHWSSTVHSIANFSILYDEYVVIGNESYDNILVAYIGNRAELTLPSSIDSIEYYAFMNTSITDLVIPSTVKFIETNTYFSGNSITFKSTTPPLSKEATYKFYVKKIYVPSSAYELYYETLVGHSLLIHPVSE